jgi:hypothetical protein
MGRIDELVSAEFAAWEQRGRGWRVWPEPVRPEPPFREFTGYKLAQSKLEADDGRRPGLLASLFDSLEKRINPKPPLVQEETVEPEPVGRSEPLSAEFLASLPASLAVPEDALAAFVDSLDVCTEPTGFELLGNHEGVTIQFASSTNDAPALARQLNAFLPKLSFTQTQEGLAEEWNGADGVGFIVDFGLANEFMLPLQTGHTVDPFVGLVAVLDELQGDEMAVFQVLFQCVQNPWPGSVWRSVTDANGKAIFVNRLQIIPGTKEKLQTPLFGVVVRAAAKAESFERAAAIVRDMASPLRTFTRQEGNRLIPLSNDEYPFEEHAEDLSRRQSRRSGMILNRDELLGFVHLPSAAVRSPKLRRQIAKTKTAPSNVAAESGLLLGFNSHAGRIAEVRLSPDQRVRHAHFIGASGTGKSTLLFNLIRQDIERGEGVAVLDPHGDLVDKLLGIIPASRLEDVILLDPSDKEYSIGFNILSAHSELEKNLLASDLVSVFQRLSSSWGDQMGSVLGNAIRAFLESSRGGTLGDLRRFLLEPDFRNEFLTTVSDPEIVYYWRRGFVQLAGNKSIGPILTRLETFLGPKPIRHMVSQPVNRLDFNQIMDSGKIFLAKLSQGLFGKENSYLLGSLLVSRFQQTAMSRQAQTVRKDYWLYADEFQNFITPSMAEILAGTRKYRLGLILAHQELRQLERDREVAGAVFNCCTRVVFRVGDEDARKLAEGFASFEARDLQNLDTGQAICRVERSDYDFNLTVPFPEDEDPSEGAERRQQIVTASRKKYGTARADIEAAFRHSQKEPRPEASSGQTESTLPRERFIQPASVAPPPIVEPAPPPPPSAEAKATHTQPIHKPAPPDMGRGGAQHQAIQQRLKSVGESLGFRAVIEQEILDGQGSVDLVLEKPNQAIACEITITTTIDHEVGNVAKCLKAGFAKIAVVATDEHRLRKLEAAVKNSLGAQTNVGYFLPDQIIAWLESLALQEVQPAPTEERRRGYKVTRSIVRLSPEELKTREAEAIRLVAESMKRRAK